MSSTQATGAAQSGSSGAAEELRARIASREARIAVVGLGYVGLPLAGALHDAGFGVVGFDVDHSKIEKLARAETYLSHLGEELVRKLSDSPRFSATANYSDLADADAIILCVPTPLGTHREPDLEYVPESTRQTATVLRRGQLVVLESTTYPGTTRAEMLPILAETGLVPGEDFFLAYSPEREDPGRAGTSTSTIPKLVGGIDDASGDLAELLYRAAIQSVHRVPSAEVAEAAKLLENIYRAVNIALVNELKVVLTELDIDVWQVVEAASTKPFGFQAFYPGPGLGGHCIPIDPFYLTWKAKEVGLSTRFIELAGEVNSQMPLYVVDRVAAALNDDRKSVNGARILISGVAYKPNVDDIRESPAAEIFDLLVERGAEVTYHDPYVPEFPSMRRHRIDSRSVALDADTLAASDCVLIVTDHANVDYARIGEHAPLVVDSRNVMSRVPAPKARVVKA